MNNDIDIRITQLLCSRICHDLVGPISAVNTAIELMNDEGISALDTEVLGLLERSAQEANHRLTFYRTAFGLAGDANAMVRFDKIKELANDFLASDRISLDWSEVKMTSLPSGAGKMLTLLLLLVSETLPKGGEIRIKIQALSGGIGLACVAQGNDAFLHTEVNDVLTGKISPNELTSRGIPAKFLNLLVIEHEAQLDISEESGQISLATFWPTRIMT